MGSPFLIEDGKMQSDLDANFNRIINLDTSNLPPSGIPPTIHPTPNHWLHDWDATTLTWGTTQPTFSDIQGNLTFNQQQGIFYLGTIQTGVWHAFPIEPAYLPKLNEILTPDGEVSMAGHRLTHMADPIDPLDAVNRQFMDLLLQGLNPKEGVRAATTVAVALSGLQTIDGITLNIGDRVLVKDNGAGTSAQNGIYVAAAGSWTRSTDADHGTADAGFTDLNSLDRGAYCVVLDGAINVGTSWFQKLEVAHIAGDLKSFVIFSAPLSVIAGAGLDQTGNTIFAVGTTNRITIGSGIDIATGYVGQTSLTTLGTITTGTWHGTVLGSDWGGTGIDNNGFTIDIAGNFSTSLSSTAGSLNFTIGPGATNVTVPSTGTLATLSGTEIFQHKSILKRYNEVASSAQPAINVQTTDIFAITALAQPITSMTTNLTGTPVDGQELVIWIKDNGTLRTITWGGKYAEGDTVLLPTITDAGKWMFLWFMWNKQLTQWVLTQKITGI